MVCAIFMLRSAPLRRTDRRFPFSMSVFDAGVKAHMEAFAAKERELSLNFSEEGWSQYLAHWKNNGDGCVMIR